MRKPENAAMPAVSNPYNIHIRRSPNAVSIASENAAKYDPAPNAAIGMPASSAHSLDKTVSQPSIMLQGTGAAV